jgi:hypothetical protein
MTAGVMITGVTKVSNSTTAHVQVQQSKIPEWLRYQHQRKWLPSWWKWGHMYRKWERNAPPVITHLPHFLPSAWRSIILKPFHVDHTYRGMWKDSFHQSWNLQTENTASVILWMCQTDFGSFWTWITGSNSASSQAPRHMHESNARNKRISYCR